MVGLQGVAIAERAYQQARDYARSRVQGRPVGAAAEASASPIIHHPDVRRMLLSMRAATEATRALAYYAAGAIDRGAARPRRQSAMQRTAPRRSADPGGQGLVHRPRRRGRLDRRPGAWRHGLHRGDRRRAASTRRAHRADLRGHQRHPGQRPGRPQAGPRQGRGGARHCSPKCARPPSRELGRRPPISPRSGARSPPGSRARNDATALSGRGRAGGSRGRVGRPISISSASCCGGWLMARQALAADRRLARATATRLSARQDRDRAVLCRAFPGARRRATCRRSSAAPACSALIPTGSEPT